jgi:hypothetical protein
MSAPVKVGVVEKILERSGMEPSLLRKVAAQVPGNAAREGLTEAAQEAINITAEDFVKKTDRIWDSEDWNRIVESGIRGSIAGGAFGVPGSVAERVRERAAEPERLAQDIATEEERLAQIVPEAPLETLPPPMVKIDRNDLLQAGLKPQSVYVRELTGKDPSIPEEASQIEATLEKMRNNSKMDPEVLASVENVIEAYKARPVEETVAPERPSLTTIPYDTVQFAGEGQPLQRSSGEADIIDFGGRKIVMRDINGVMVPFYLSSGMGGKAGVEAGKWYPFFGIGKDGWINKTKDTEISNYYGSEALRNAAMELDSTIGDIRQDQNIPKVGATGAHIDFINQNLNPVENNQANTLTQVRENIDSIVGQLEPTVEATPTEVKTSPAALFSQSPLVNADPTERGMTRDAVDDVVQTIKGTWTNAPSIQTLQSVNELPQELREQAERDGVNPRGVYDPDSQQVFLIADNIPNQAQAAITLAHEALGHFGLRVVLGKNFNKMMDDLYRTNKMVRDRADEKIKEGDDQRTAVEEVLAEMAQEVYDTRVPENKNKISALQKVINAIKQFLRNLGVPVGRIKDEEVIGLIANARKSVVRGPVKAAISAKEQAKYSKRSANIFKGLNEQVNNLPGMDSQLAEDFKNSMSNLPDKIRGAALGFLTMPQIEEVYGTQLPSLKKLTSALESRAADMMRRRQSISKNIQDWYKIANKHKAVLPRFFAIANRTTLDQIDVLDPAEADNPLTKEFKKLPQDLQNVYKQLREDYKKSSDEYMSLLLSNLKQSKASEIRLKMEAKRMKVYLPLFRMGDYWVSYNDQNGERVSMAFESVREAKQAADKARADGMDDVKEFTRLQQITYRSAPPTGFMGSVVKQLEDQGVKPEVIDGIYQTYLSLFPAQSVRQQFRKREGRLGFREDVFQVYANVATRMANQLANMKNAEPLESAVTGVREEFEQNPTMELRDVVDNMQKQLDFIRNPVNGNLVNKASYFSYMWFIAGNVSSALVNLTQMPIVVYPLLGGKYGFDQAFSAMKQAFAMYWKGGKDNNSEFLPDWTFGANAKGELKQLYDRAVQSQAIRRSTGYELTEARKVNVEDFTGRRAKIEHGLGWIFQNSERANREITLIAAFNLARKGKDGKPGMSVDDAIDYALSVVNDAHGAALAEIGPRYFQQGIGKVAFTFKRFAQAQIYLLGRLFHQAFKNADKDTRDLARKQLLGIAGMSYIFAGIQGMPLYGAVSVLANMLADDDDEPFDMDATVRGAFGDIGYKGPVNALLAVDIASRTGFNGLLWRDDPKRLAEIGPTLYAIEQAAGPAYGAFRNAERGLKLVQEGEWQRGMEALSPSFVRNGLKAFRLGTEGAMTKDGVLITDDIGAYNTFMQIFGFNPAALAEAQARAGAEKRAERAIMDRRAALLEKAFLARQEGDADGLSDVMETIGKFNEKNPEVPITAKSLRASALSRQRKMAESTGGVYLNPKLRNRLIETYGGGEED